MQIATVYVPVELSVNALAPRLHLQSQSILLTHMKLKLWCNVMSP